MIGEISLLIDWIYMPQQVINGILIFTPLLIFPKPLLVTCSSQILAAQTQFLPVLDQWTSAKVEHFYDD